MAVRAILPLTDPLLRQKAQPVERFDPALRQLVADLFETVGPRPASGVASGARATSVATSLRLRADADVPTGPVLLVDDACASGWTLTIATALLREAGSGEVLPLVLHKRPS